MFAVYGLHRNSQKQNSNIYVGLSQQNSRLRTLGGSSSQNQFRQASVYPASVHSSSLNTQTAVNSGYSHGLSASRYTQTASQPAQSSVRLVQSNSVLKPNWQTTNSKWINAQNVPKNAFEFSTAIASGSSVKYKKNQKTLSDFNKKISLPVQQGTQRTGYLSSSSASVQSPSRQSYSFLNSASHQSVAQKRPSAAYYRQGGSSFRQSNAVAPEPHGEPVRVQTSFTAPARRVPYHRPDSSKPFSSLQTGRIGNYPSQAKAGKPFKSEGFPVIIRNIQGHYQPSSISNVVSHHPSYSRSNLPKPNLPVASQHGNVRIPTGQTLKYRPSYNFREQNPSSTNTFQSQWSSRNSAQGAHTFLGSGSKGGSSPQRFHPTRIYNIPERFGGHAIRRLKEPADEEEVAVQKPPTNPTQRPPTYPPQRPATLPPKEIASYKPKAPSIHPESKWMRFRPPSTLTGADMLG
ncbi:uncharacterized protein LOC111565496 isoform X2 [Amphiprion ocellaris]|uniref:uncharacterized protein LOC111565496 isoform X2 n=1 Tax=Amphiprion ocellaris TaxID=80972 RepID=UPI002410BD48|nr:uncharacterized protein LOC111565496 isoform X2 [Amphiprion ocellaris]